MRVDMYIKWRKWFLDYAEEENGHYGDLDTSVPEKLSPKQIADINYDLMVRNICLSILSCKKCATCKEHNPNNPYHVFTAWRLDV